MSKFEYIKSLWDEGVKFTFDDLSTPIKTINMIINEIEKIEKNENEKIDDLYSLLCVIKNLSKSRITKKTSVIVSKYYKTTINFQSMSKFEQFGVLQAVIQKLIYDLAGEQD
jgi:hypothetical protein